MLRLLGLLSLGNLLFGGRHHRRMLHRGLFFGAILGYLAHKDFDMEQVEEDARKAARTVKRTVHEAARAAKREIRDARRAEHFNKVHADVEARKAEHDRRMAERMMQSMRKPKPGELPGKPADPRMECGMPKLCIESMRYRNVIPGKQRPFAN